MRASRHAPILTFHALEDAPDPICFPPGVFRRGLEHLAANDFRACRLEETAACISREGSFPGRSMALTFDDGYETVYREAFPALQEHGMTATVFLTVGARGSVDAGTRLPSLGGRVMLNWGQIREMQQSGICFGAHTLTHPDLTRIGRAHAETEMRESQAKIEDALGTPVRTFAYPYGRFNPSTRDIVRRYFDLACSDRLGLISTASDLFALPRVDAHYLRSDRLFGLLLSPLLHGYVAARAVPRGLRRALVPFRES